jgi:hypothetical protein
MKPETHLAFAVAPTAELPTGPRNILLLSAGDGSAANPASDESLNSVAEWLTQYGYVYVARAGQKTMEDDAAGVRYMPLHRDALPPFGSLAMVVVFDNLALVQEAQEHYANTLIVFVESASSVSARAQLAALMMRRAAE